MRPVYLEPLTIVIQNKKFVLRLLRKEDAETFIDYRTLVGLESAFTYKHPDQPVMTIAQAEKRIQTLNESTDSCTFGFFINENGKDRKVSGFIFRCEMSTHPWRKHVGGFGMAVLKEFWGCGLAQHMLIACENVARQMGVTRIEATVNQDNERGIRLYQKMGYGIEGLQTNSLFVDGKYQSMYSIFKMI